MAKSIDFIEARGSREDHVETVKLRIKHLKAEIAEAKTEAAAEALNVQLTEALKNLDGLREEKAAAVQA